MNKNRSKPLIFFLVAALLLAVLGGYYLRKSPDFARQQTVSSPLVIGFAVSSLHSSFMVALVDGAMEAAKNNDNVKLIVVNGNLDAATQLNQLEDLITRQPDAIILNALDGEGVIPAVQRANAKGIPIFALDLGANGGTVASFVETDNLAVGREAARFIAEKLKDRYGEYKGNVVDLMGGSGMSSTRNREIGFAEEMSRYPGIQIIVRQSTDLDQEKALNNMTNILQGHSQIDAVFGANDSAAWGASRAIHQTGRLYPVGDKRHIIVCGVDGSGPVLAEIRQEKIDATVSQNPVKMAGEVVKLAIEFLRQGKVPPQHLYYPHILITKDNIDSDEVNAYGKWSEASAN